MTLPFGGLTIRIVGPFPSLSNFEFGLLADAISGTHSSAFNHFREARITLRPAPMRAEPAKDRVIDRFLRRRYRRGRPNR